MIRKRPLRLPAFRRSYFSFPSPFVCFQLRVPAAFFMMSYVFLIKQADILAANTSRNPAVESDKSVVREAKASSKKYLARNAQLLARPLFQQGIRWAWGILSVRYLMGPAASPTPHFFHQFSPSVCSLRWGDKEENGAPLAVLCPEISQA